MKAIISFYVVPLKKEGGTSASDMVAKAVQAVKDRGYNFVVTAASTVFESPSVEEGFRVIEDAIERLRKAGADRVIVEIKVDVRWDKELSLENMPKKVIMKLNH